MSRNTIRRSNDIQAKRLWKVVAALLVLTVFALVFAFLQVRNIQLADDLKNMEMALDEMNKRNSILQIEIERRVTPRALQQQVKDFNLNLISIAELPTVEVNVRRCSSTSYAWKGDEE